MKRGIALICISTLLFNVFSNGVKTNAKDENGGINLGSSVSLTKDVPISINSRMIKSIKFDKTEVNITEELNVSIELDENLSELYEVRVYIGLKNRNEREEVNLQYNEVQNNYTGNIKFDKNVPSGEWEIKSISINNFPFYVNDDVGYRNFFYINKKDKLSCDIPKLLVKGTEGEFDTTVPVFKEVTFNEVNAKVNDKVKVSLRIDEVSKVRHDITLSLGVKNHKMPGIILENFIYNNKTGLYESYFDVDNNMPSGEYIIQRLLISDEEGNYTYLEDDELRDTSTINIIAKENIDATAPIFNSISVESKSVKEGETIKISVDAYDNESGINFIKLAYANKSTNRMDIMLSYNPNTKKYEKEIQVNKYTPNGEWDLVDISILNNAESKYTNRFLFIYDQVVLEGGGFYVHSEGKTDTIKPTIKDVGVESTNVVIGEKIKYYIDVEDNESGLNNITMTYNIVSENDGILFYYFPFGYLNFEFNEQSKRYEAELAVTKVLYLNHIKPDFDISNPEYSGIALIKPMNRINDYCENNAELYDLPLVKIYNTDINSDEEIDILDLSEIAKLYNKKEVDEGWNYKADFNDDKVIDLFDMVKLSKQI